MIKPLTLSLLFFILLGSPLAFGEEKSGPAAKPSVSISLKKGDPKELATQRQLERLLATYDVSPWVFTNKVVIDGDRRVIPHSHPVLTLSTRHLKDDELLLATFLGYRPLYVDLPDSPRARMESARRAQEAWIESCSSLGSGRDLSRTRATTYLLD